MHMNKDRPERSRAAKPMIRGSEERPGLSSPSELVVRRDAPLGSMALIGPTSRLRSSPTGRWGQQRRDRLPLSLGKRSDRLLGTDGELSQKSAGSELSPTTLAGQ
jgi:hypothetical protein